MTDKVEEGRLRSVAYYTRTALNALVPGDQFTTAELVAMMPSDWEPNVNAVGASLAKLVDKGILTTLGARMRGTPSTFVLVERLDKNPDTVRPAMHNKERPGGHGPDPLEPQPPQEPYPDAPQEPPPQSARAADFARHIDMAIDLIASVERSALMNAPEDALWQELIRRRTDAAG